MIEQNPLLFDLSSASSEPSTSHGSDPVSLDQWFTPTWAAEALISHYFPDLGPRDMVLDPSCGRGAFLGSIPDDVPAFGVEIDAGVAEIARQATGREVLIGDFRSIAIYKRPTAIITNPPFRFGLPHAFIERAEELMDIGGRVGLLLPCYLWQTPEAVLRHSPRWSMRQDMLPRTLFPNNSTPLCFTILTREKVPVMAGFALYAEADAVARLTSAYRKTVESAPRSAWVRCVADALKRLGGEASLPEIYAEIGGRRPSSNPWWKEQVRKVLQGHAVRKSSSTYALAT